MLYFQIDLSLKQINLKAIMKNKHENDLIKQAHERLFAKYGIKTVWVDKTGTNAIFSNRPIPKNK